MARAFGKIVHVLPLSLCDYPGKLAAVVFFAGCNLRCPFCYNAELVLPELVAKLTPLSPAGVRAWLRERGEFLDGVVLTGGEPTLAPDLGTFIQDLKAQGLRVKLDTNGTHPALLEELLGKGLLDYVALDLKAPFPRYPEYVGLLQAERIVGLVQDSLAVIRERAPDYEFRTTVAPGLGKEDLLAIARAVAGGKRYVLQPFVAPRGKRLVAEGWRGRPALGASKLWGLLPELRGYLPTELRA